MTDTVHHIVEFTKFTARCKCGWDTFNMSSQASIYKLVARHVVENQFEIKK